ncbi:MAG: lipopolysaccharide biosynthesis protein [Pseudomonadota bacterium]
MTITASDAGPSVPARESLRVLADKYARAVSGDVARLFIQLFYFYLVANTLTISEFGLFATASSVGIVLSRVSGFGFLSPLYRIATVKPQLIGVYTGGYILAQIISLPVVVGLALLVHWAFFGGQMALLAFLLVAFSEVLFWRTIEAVINVNKGLERFGRASVIIVIGFSMKAIAALMLAMSDAPSLSSWAHIYFVVQAVAAIGIAAVFYPRQRPRFRPKLYLRRLPDALSVSGAEVLFYVQSELDKLVVLAFGGSTAAGIYAIIMRLVDLTAMPVRTFSTLLTQRLMRRPGLMRQVKMRVGFEAGVFLISTLALTAMVVILWIKPDILGSNVATAAGFLWLVILVPAFRNLIEYQSELLYGRGQTLIRLIVYAVLGAVKAGLIIALFSGPQDPAHWLFWTNAVFASLYLISASFTYSVLDRDVKPV